MRELELSTAVLGSVTLEPGPGCGTAHILLPVSKGDVQALGKTRSHVCCCKFGGMPSEGHEADVQHVFDTSWGACQPVVERCPFMRHILLRISVEGGGHCVLAAHWGHVWGHWG